MLTKLRDSRGEGYIDVAVLVLCTMLVVALAVKVLPVYIAKSQLDTFAAELCREAEIAGRVGSETSLREQVLREKTGLDPVVTWSKTGKIQLNQEFTVTVTLRRDNRPLWRFRLLSHYADGKSHGEKRGVLEVKIREIYGIIALGHLTRGGV